MDAKKTTMTSMEAEKYLQAALGEPDGYWRVFLQNNRRPDRAPTLYVIPYAVLRGRPVYSGTELDIFIAKHRSEAGLRAKTLGRSGDALTAIGGWPTRRPFVGWITPQVEESTGVTFVRLHLSDPFAIYKLSPDQARQVAAELLVVANAVDQAEGERS